MKTKKSATLALLSVATAMFLFSPAALAASSTPLNLGIGGIITNSGNQTYTFGGGNVVAGVVLGNPIIPGSSISYHIDASVNGLTTSGSGHISIPASQISGGHGAVVVSIQILDELPAAVFPLDFTNPPTDNCQSGCTSQIPLLFEGVATISNAGPSTTVPVFIESPYWNPFGGPIFLSSADGFTLSLVVTYTSAIILWSNVVLQGSILGTFGTTPITGGYQTTSTSVENLVTGNEVDSGQMVFAGMSVPSLNSAGTFSGKTTISTVGEFDCAPFLGLPDGTCTATGASSIGSFTLHGIGTTIKGSYSTTWSVPSLTTTTSATASVTS